MKGAITNIFPEQIVTRLQLMSPFGDVKNSETNV